jgi:hypothetical protein
LHQFRNRMDPRLRYSWRMSIGRLLDEDDPLAGAPEEVLAAFIALGGRASRLRAERKVVPTRGAYQSAQAAPRAAPTSSALLNRKA